jgi:hypothetical protein
MKSERIVTTEAELQTLIGVASSITCDESVDDGKIEMSPEEFAAALAIKLSDHLTGRKSLPEDLIMTAKLVRAIVEGPCD